VSENDIQDVNFEINEGRDDNIARDLLYMPKSVRLDDRPVRSGKGIGKAWSGHSTGQVRYGLEVRAMPGLKYIYR
jgi:hypothetical protein